MTEPDSLLVAPIIAAQVFSEEEDNTKGACLKPIPTNRNSSFALFVAKGLNSLVFAQHRAAAALGAAQAGMVFFRFLGVLLADL